jgi:hypothetical protein
MQRLNITAAILFMVFSMACNRSPKTNANENSVSKSAMAQPAAAQSQSSEAGAVLAENIPTAMPPYKAAEPSAAAGMNPPHGQPNHRCDIAVGVPLDSPPGTGKTPPANPQLNATTQTATPTSTAPGMNPPHGQPNHRCDIPVGKPLDSPPGTGKQPTPSVVSQQNLTPQTANSPITSATTPTAPGMNPPHGQPNHRCDIAVGVPLDSPPRTGEPQTIKSEGASLSKSSPPLKIVPAPK